MRKFLTMKDSCGLDYVCELAIKVKAVQLIAGYVYLR
jgi:hypothetical protein